MDKQHIARIENTAQHFARCGCQPGRCRLDLWGACPARFGHGIENPSTANSTGERQPAPIAGRIDQAGEEGDRAHWLDLRGVVWATSGVQVNDSLSLRVGGVQRLAACKAADVVLRGVGEPGDLGLSQAGGAQVGNDLRPRADSGLVGEFEGGSFIGPLADGEIVETDKPFVLMPRLSVLGATRDEAGFTRLARAVASRNVVLGEFDADTSQSVGVLGDPALGFDGATNFDVSIAEMADVEVTHSGPLLCQGRPATVLLEHFRPDGFEIHQTGVGDLPWQVRFGVDAHPLRNSLRGALTQQSDCSGAAKPFDDLV